MRRILTLADRVVGFVIDGFGLIAGGVIGAMALTISAEVIGRALGYRGFGWTLEMAEYGLLVVGFLAAPWVLRHGDHIRVDVVLRSVGQAWFARLIVLANLIAGLTCLVLAWYGAQAALEAWERGSILFKHFRMPQWIILSIMPMGAALLAWEFFARTLRRLAGQPVPGEGSGGPAL